MQWIEILKVILIGVVEGITEWLPISSTGHMMLVDAVLKFEGSDAFKEMFFVVIQFGAIVAVIITFYEKIAPFGISTNYAIDRQSVKLWMKVGVACIPSILIAVPFDSYIDSIFYNNQTIIFTLIFYGVCFIAIEKKMKNRPVDVNDINKIGYAHAMVIGMFQVLAIVPGTSRSGATILGAMILGTSRTVAAEFTFLLAIPTMLGASLLKLVKYGLVFTFSELIFLVTGLITALLTSLLIIKSFMKYISKHDFAIFGWYRIVLGVALIIVFH